MRLLFEIYKNLKLIFRNWSSLLLIVLAPFLLILLAGYSFSGEQLHDIKIGVHAQEDLDLGDLAKSVSGFGEVFRYESADRCIRDMIDEKVHICLDIKGSLSVKGGEIPSGEVVFYYDNTRKRISLLLMSEIKDYFGLTAEQISLISTQEIISSMQNLLVFLNERIDDVDSVKNESEKIMSDLEVRKQRLIVLRDDFEPRYLVVKSVQADFNSNKRALDNQSESLLESLEGLRDIIAEIDQNISNTTGLDLALLDLEGQIAGLESSANTTVEQVNNISDSLNLAVAELDEIDLILNQEINMTDEYILLINNSVQRIDNISSEAKSKMSGLSEINPSLAGRIAKPITQSFKALVGEVKDIQLAFPILLSTVIIFISMIFSNIITSLEINNKAYTRNILAPVNDITYTAGLAVTNFLVVSFQVAVLLAVAQLNFGIEVTSHLGEIIPISVVLILIFVFIGMVLAYMSKTIQTSILSSTFLALAFFLFSDALNALEAMPQLASKIAVFNPVVIVNSMLRKVLFFDISISGLQAQAGLLIIYMAAAALLLVIVSKIKNKQRL